jgi:hypothetical protein
MLDGVRCFLFIWGIFFFIIAISALFFLYFGFLFFLWRKPLQENPKLRWGLDDETKKKYSRADEYRKLIDHVTLHPESLDAKVEYLKAVFTCHFTDAASELPKQVVLSLIEKFPEVPGLWHEWSLPLLMHPPQDPALGKLEWSKHIHGPHAPSEIFENAAICMRNLDEKFAEECWMTIASKEPLNPRPWIEVSHILFWSESQDRKKILDYHKKALSFRWSESEFQKIKNIKKKYALLYSDSLLLKLLCSAGTYRKFTPVTCFSLFNALLIAVEMNETVFVQDLLAEIRRTRVMEMHQVYLNGALAVAEIYLKDLKKADEHLQKVQSVEIVEYWRVDRFIYREMIRSQQFDRAREFLNGRIGKYQETPQVVQALQSEFPEIVIGVEA